MMVSKKKCSCIQDCYSETSEAQLHILKSLKHKTTRVTIAGTLFSLLSLLLKHAIQKTSDRRNSLHNTAWGKMVARTRGCVTAGMCMLWFRLWFNFTLGNIFGIFLL